MRGPFLLLGLLLAVPASAGLFGTDAPGRIPIPARLFTVEVQDVGGTSLRVERTSFDGEVFVYGTVGLAQVTVPFDRIDALVIELGEDDDHRTAVITDPEGQVLRVTVESDVPVYGRTPFGNYKIEIGQVRRLEVLSETPRTEQSP